MNTMELKQAHAQIHDDIGESLELAATAVETLNNVVHDISSAALNHLEPFLKDEGVRLEQHEPSVQRRVRVGVGDHLRRARTQASKDARPHLRNERARRLGIGYDFQIRIGEQDHFELVQREDVPLEHVDLFEVGGVMHVA